MTQIQSSIAAIILAAGGSSRYGEPKQLLDWQGQPLIAHMADVAWTAGLDPVVVVVGANASLAASALASRPVQVVRNYRWQEGVSSSLHVGIAALPQHVEAAIFLPVDQPLITPQLLQSFVQHHREAPTGIIIPNTGSGQRGAPALFDRTYFTELACLSGDVGGRAILDKHQSALTYLPVPDPQSLTDIDTPDAYEALKAATMTASQALDFSSIKGIICDMDGVLWRGNTPLPGLAAFFQIIEDLGLEHVLVTNNSSNTPTQYVEKLARMGVQTTTDHILNSAIAAARYVADTQPGASVYAIGGPGVKKALDQHGLAYHFEIDTAEADYVVVGWDRQLTWQKLATATRLILDGAAFVGTNPDLTFPMEDSLAPGNGAQTAALTAATGVEPVMAGKPSRLLYEQAMRRMQTTPETTLVIGDRLDTDILGGIRLGMVTVLMLTGISQRDELHTSPIRPTAVMNDLPDLVQKWRAALR